MYRLCLLLIEEKLWFLHYSSLQILWVKLCFSYSTTLVGGQWSITSKTAIPIADTFEMLISFNLESGVLRAYHLLMGLNKMLTNILNVIIRSAEIKVSIQSNFRATNMNFFRSTICLNNSSQWNLNTTTEWDWF